MRASTSLTGVARLGRKGFMLLAPALLALSACGTAVSPAPSSVAPASSPGSSPSVAAASSAAPASRSNSASTSSSPAPSSPVASTAAAGPSTSAQAAGTLTIGIGTIASQFDPTVTFSGDPSFTGGQALIFDGLTRIDFSTGQPVLQPALALSWTSPTPTTTDFKLRPNVTFSNGDPFTAEDVKFTFDRIRDPATKSLLAGSLANVSEVKVLDPMTVELVTKQPDPLLTKTVASLLIVPSKYFQSTGATNFAKAPIGTGWYTIGKFISHQSLELNSRDSGWRGPATSKHVVFEEIPDVAARVAALKTGGIDIDAGVNSDSIDSLKQTDNVVTASLGMTDGIYMLSSGSKAGPMKDQRVRQAMIQAVDRSSIASYLMNGLVKPATQLVPPNVFGYNPQVDQTKLRPYDVNKAKSLLAEAGVTTFSTELDAAYATVNAQSTLESYASYESKIGVTVKLNAMDFASWAAAFNSRNLSPLFNIHFSYTPAMDAQQPLQWFQSKYGPDKWLNDPKYDALFQSASHELDSQKRLQDLQQLNAMLVNEDVGLWFYDTPQIWGISKNVQNFSVRPDQQVEVYKISKS